MIVRWICLALMLSVLTPHEASGQARAAALARIKLLNTRAMDEYDGLEFEAAKSLLSEAITVAQEASITRGKTLVATYLNLGIVVGAGLNDRINAMKFFTLAISLNPNTALSPTRATPTLEEMFNSAKENYTPPASTHGVTGLKHEALDETDEGKPVKILAQVGEDVGAERVVVFFKPSGVSEYALVPMRKVKPERYMGKLPAAKIKGRSFYYYIEAQDGDGQRLMGHGTDLSPNIVTINRKKGNGAEPKGDDQVDSDKVFSFAVMAGVGIGLVYGGTSEHDQPYINPLGDRIDVVDIKPGFAPTLLHVAPELSYHLSKNWHISLLGRIQLITGATISDAFVGGATSNNEISFFGEVRAKRFFGEEPFRLYASFGAGGGQIRHRIPLGDYDATGRTMADGTPNDTIDSRVAGVAAVSFGGGFVYMFSSYIGFVLDLNTLILVPDFAANLDLNTGLLFSF